MPTLGERVRALRRERGLTQRRLAEQAGVDFTYLSKIENDRLEHTPSVRTLLQIARALGADELDLMELANKLPPPLSGLAGQPEALRFFRHASATMRSPSEWRELSAYLDRRERRRGGAARSRRAT